MRYTHAYRVTYAPRYDRPDEDAARIRENVLAQTALLNALRYLFVAGDGCRVELRYVINPVNRNISPFLLVAAPDGGPGPDPAVLERLLPSDYGWQRIPLGATGKFPSLAKPADREWRTVLLRRRFELVDLPGSWSRLVQVAAPSGDDTPPALGVGPAGDCRVLPPLLPLGPRQRLRVYNQEQLCVPVLAALKDESPDRRRLCQELQHAAPAVLAVSLQPLADAELAAARTAAGQLRRWADPFMRELANARFAHPQDVAATFDRFALPANNLCRLTVRVAALAPAQAQSVAHTLSAHLGGMRAFDVVDEPTGKDTLDHIGAPRTADPGEISRRLTAEQAIAEDPEYPDFLGLLPDLYTLDEAAQLLRLPYGFREGLPGIETRLVAPFFPVNLRHQPSSAAPPEGRVRLGLIRSSGAIAPRADGDADWHSIPAADLTKHALIVGSTGSGKSVAARLLLREVTRLGVPFLAIEPVKTEYYGRLKNDIPDLRRWRLEGTADGRAGSDYLVFDPLRLQRGVSVARHVSFLKSCFAAAFPLGELHVLLLENALRAFYTAPREDGKDGGCGLSLLARGGPAAHVVLKDGTGTPTPYPSFRGFCRFMLNRYLPADLNPTRAPNPPEFAQETMNLFRRRFVNLAEGQLGLAFRRADEQFLRDPQKYWNAFPTLLARPTVVELDAVPDNEQKALVMAFLLTFLYEQRQAEDLLRREAGTPDGPPALRHLVLVEEAHRLLGNTAAAGKNRGESSGDDAAARAVGLFVDMLAEIRAYGQGLVVVEQIPTKIVPEAVKNTNLKLMLRLTSEDDREFLGTAMNFTDEQKRFVTGLRTGQGVVFEESLDQPVLLTVPDPKSWGALFPT